MMRAGLGMIVALVLAACGGPSDAPGQPAANQARPAAPAAPLPAPAAFVASLSGADLYAIESSRLALRRSDSAELRGLAQMIVADHQRASTALAAAAREADPALAPAAALAPGQQSELERLAAASPQAFDREYLRQQVDAHEQALTLVSRYARAREAPAPLRRHAAGQIAPIQTHLIRARSLASRQTLE